MRITNHQLFVYGSLRSDSQHPAHAYISKHFVLLGQARIKGKVYDLGEYPGAVATAEQCYIIGELYVLKEGEDFQWVITKLDNYEGVNEEPPLYQRETTQVFINNEATTAWMYWYNQPVDGKTWIISGDVMQYQQQNSKL
jgi:gamma-glutamylcyclotransferase (GGCT)/AIG2-like uncharacterized protein YtfP